MALIALTQRYTIENDAIASKIKFNTLPMDTSQTKRFRITLPFLFLTSRITNTQIGLGTTPTFKNMASTTFYCAPVE